MSTLWIVFGTILAVFATYTIIAPTFLNFPHYARRVQLACPTYRTAADINVGAMMASLTAAYGAPKLKVQRCNLLAPGERCEETCLKGQEI